MKAELEKNLLLREILLLSHAAMAEGQGTVLLSDEEVKSLNTEDLEELRQIRSRLRDLTRSLGGAKGR